MLQIKLQVITAPGDLDGLPLGTRIATNNNKILFRDEAWGRKHWIEEGTLSPFFEPLVQWLPVIVLPPPVDLLSEAARATVCELRVEDD